VFTRGAAAVTAPSTVSALRDTIYCTPPTGNASWFSRWRGNSSWPASVVDPAVVSVHGQRPNYTQNT